MQRLKRILIAAMLILLAAFAAGLLLPRAWVVERTTVIAVPQAAVFAEINSLKRWRDWTVWYERYPNMPGEYSGPEAGVGATSRWVADDQRGAMKIMKSEPGRLVEYELLLDGGELRMDGTLVLAPEGAGTRVTWRTGGDAGFNPLRRYFALLMSYWIGRDFDASLARLKTRLEAKR